MANPLKNRFEALQAQDPCASQPQETIIENIRKERLTKEKSNQTAHSLDTSPITTSKSNAAQTSTPPPRRSSEKTTPQPTTSLKNQTHKGLPPSHLAEDQADPPPHIGKRGQAASHQHNTTRPKRHNSTHGKFP